jgi:hypothetical protein
MLGSAESADRETAVPLEAQGIIFQLILTTTERDRIANGISKTTARHGCLEPQIVQEGSRIGHGEEEPHVVRK